MSGKVKVLIVDDSETARGLLAHLVASDARFCLLGTAASGAEALRFLEDQRPDVVTMDLVMPEMDGFEATRRILERWTLPIIAVTASYRPSDVEKAFRVISAGALEVMRKPRGIQDPFYEATRKEFLDALFSLSTTAVYRYADWEHREKGRLEGVLRTCERGARCEVVAVGCSFGGPPTLRYLFSKLPATFPIPMLVAQHIAPGFLEGFVDWISRETSLKVRVARDGESLVGGTVYFAPDHLHMEVGAHGRLSLTAEPPEGGYRPSISRLFCSVGRHYGERSVGVLLTGMGRDGVLGLLQMRKLGALTVAQAEEGCILFGMPKEALAVEAACCAVPLVLLPPLLLKLAGER
jgi:two-component system chemotaxis response regulator CheB